MGQIKARAHQLIRESPEEAYEQCRTSLRFAIRIGSMEVAIAMAAVAARIAALQGL